MAIKYSNNAKTTLTSAITDTDTSISVADASVFPVLGVDDTIYLTLSDPANSVTEIVLCTGISGNVLTVTRGYENTIAQTWAVGDQASSRLTAGLLTALTDIIPTQIGNIDKILSTDGSSLYWASKPEADPWTLSADSVTLTYNANGDAETATEVIDGDTKVTTINYTAEGAASSIVITFRGIERTETLTYDTEGRVESIAVTEVAI